MHLNLEPYTATGEGDDTEKPRSPDELMITLDPPSCVAWSCSRVRRGLARLHPRLLGSILAHISQSTVLSWGIYTAKDALEDAEIWRYEGSTKYFWKDIHTELREQLGRKPTKAEVLAEGSDRTTMPFEFERQIGLNEVLPAKHPRLRLSPQDMRRLAGDRTDWAAGLTRTVADLLTQLETEHARLSDLITEGEREAASLRGEMRHAPLFALSGQQNRRSNYIHHVQEELEEVWEIAASQAGFMPNVLIRVNDRADAERAALILGTMERSLSILTDLVQLLVDDEDE